MDELDEFDEFDEFAGDDIPIPLLFLSILQASQGTYSPAEVEELYLIIQAYMEEAPSGQIVALKGGKNDA
jgi:hypothetical protein